MLKKYMSILVCLGLSFVAGVQSNSPFYEPIRKGDVKRVKELLHKHDNKIDEADVALAALRGQVDIVALLLSQGAPLDEEAMRSAVRGSCENRKLARAYEEIVQMLLKARAPFDKETLCMAVECSTPAIAKMLVNAMPNFSRDVTTSSRYKK